jgi:hypothetical protein
MGAGMTAKHIGKAARDPADVAKKTAVPAADVREDGCKHPKCNERFYSY